MAAPLNVLELVIEIMYKLRFYRNDAKSKWIKRRKKKKAKEDYTIIRERKRDG